jgi:hypothetical protein
MRFVTLFADRVELCLSMSWCYLPKALEWPRSNHETYLRPRARRLQSSAAPLQTPVLRPRGTGEGADRKMSNQNHFTDTDFQPTKPTTMSNNTEHTEQTEGMDPHDLEAIYAAANPDDEFIVKIDFSYCDVTYDGYQILSGEELGKLLGGLKSGAQVGTPNMPGSWYEEFDISDLEGAFTIHSSDPGDVKAMRSLFGESVGETSYFGKVFDAFSSLANEDSSESSGYTDWSDFISDEDAVNFTNYDGDVYLGVTSLSDFAASSLSKIRGLLVLPELNQISDDGLRFLSEHEGGIALSSMEELSDELIEAFANRTGHLQFGITHLTNHAALSLSKHLGKLCLDSLTAISDEAADLLSKHKGDMSFMFLDTISAKSAESFSKHSGDIDFSELIFDDEVASILAKKNGTICERDPVEWTNEYKS